MPRKEILFLGQKYKTQKEFEAYIRHLLYNEIGLCDDIKHTYPSHYITVIELLKRHPEFDAKTQNMCNLKIIKNALNSKGVSIMIINFDGSETDISLKCCITGKGKGKKEELMSAMRSSVDEQILLFRQNSDKKCVLCHSVSNLHVDHILHFDELVFNFINSLTDTDITIPTELGETNDNTYRRCFLDRDNMFKQQWIQYHDEHATLRILCQKCNLSRTKSKFKIPSSI